MNSYKYVYKLIGVCNRSYILMRGNPSPRGIPRLWKDLRNGRKVAAFPFLLRCNSIDFAELVGMSELPSWLFDFTHDMEPYLSFDVRAVSIGEVFNVIKSMIFSVDADDKFSKLMRLSVVKAKERNLLCANPSNIVTDFGFWKIGYSEMGR